MNLILSILINGIIAVLLVSAIGLFVSACVFLLDKMEELDRKGKHKINVIITIVFLLLLGSLITAAGITYKIF